MRKTIKAMSLFANVGIAETYLRNAGIDVVIANEIEPDRVQFYKHLYPEVDTVVGDITTDEIQRELVSKAIDENVELIIATPPCQGMSTAGKKDNDDPRNSLICYAVSVIKAVKPKYVFLENVPEQLITKIMYHDEMVLIPDYLQEELSGLYDIEQLTVNAADYGVPQSRDRAIFLLTSKKCKKQWHFPEKVAVKKTMFDAIGDLPILDPLVNDISYEEQMKMFPLYEERLKAAQEISKWHIPPSHVFRQVYAMMHTPTGKSAFENVDEFKPKKKDGQIVRGYKNTYKRQEWDKPAFTVTMFNRTIGSQNNVHPGRLVGQDEFGNDIYSDPRVLTIFELMRVMSLPDDWDIPDGYSDNFIRSVIGEGIPPLLALKIMEVIPDEA